MLAQRYQKKMLKCNKNNYKSTKDYYNGAAVHQWCGFKSRRGKNKNLTALKSNSNTVWFNFQTYIIYICIYTCIYIYKIN
jgi:hypothetical protein